MGCYVRRRHHRRSSTGVIPRQAVSKHLDRVDNCPTFDPATTVHSQGASHTIFHHTHLSDVQLSYPTRHPKFSFHRHGEGHVSNPQRPSPAESRKLNRSFQPTQPTSRRHQRSRTDCTGRITSHISQSDITGKAARSTRHVPGVCDFLLFRDGILSVYHVQVRFRFLQNGCRARDCR